MLLPGLHDGRIHLSFTAARQSLGTCEMGIHLPMQGCGEERRKHENEDCCALLLPLPLHQTQELGQALVAGTREVSPVARNKSR